MIRAVIAVVALTLGAGIVVAQQQDPAAARKALMKENGKNMYTTGLSGMVKGVRPYDQAAVDAALAQLDTSSKQIGSLFPDTAKASVPGGNYSASAKIWENRADFDAKLAKYISLIAEAKAKIKDLDSLKAEWPILNNQGCEGCHETYRVKNG